MPATLLSSQDRRARSSTYVRSWLAGGYKNIIEVRATDESQALNLFRNKLFSASSSWSPPCSRLYSTCYHLGGSIYQSARLNKGIQLSTGLLKNDKKRESLLHWDSGDLRRDESASNSVVLTW